MERINELAVIFICHREFVLSLQVLASDTLLRHREDIALPKITTQPRKR
jgi:hypothetical protein